MKTPPPNGQVLVGVLLILVILSTMVPLMVFYTQREAAWTDKQNKSTTAFHLAEAGIEKGYLALSQSTATWVALQRGILMTNYQFDKSFGDVTGGNYTISITSGPLSQQATIISVGIDARRKETRAVKAVYGNAPLGDIAVYGGAGVDVDGNNLTVEWGSVVSPNDITPNSENHPSYWSAGTIIGKDANAATPPNCDAPNCWFWHSYQTNIPPAPSLAFAAYKSSAMTTPDGPCGAYYSPGNKSGTCSDSSGNTYYVEGNWTDFDGPMVGTVIVLGNFSTGNGNMNGTSISASVPQGAWKQYCNDWSYYKTNYHPANTAAACPGLYSSYRSPASLTATIEPVIQGLLYVGGDFSGPTGGGNTHMVYGVLYVKGMCNLNSNSHVKVFYSEEASKNMLLTRILLDRVSWQDTITPWPTGLAY